MAIIIDRNCPSEITDSISRRFPSENIIRTIKLKNITGATSTHPDMQIHFLSGHEAVCAPECREYYASSLPDVQVTAGSLTPKDTYPLDIAYNAARLGNYVIANLRYTEPYITEYYKKRGFELVNSKQGYAKCNLAVMSGTAVITGDEGMRTLLSRLSGVKCLMVDQSGVVLSGYRHGFIGGASGLIRGTAVFLGDPGNRAKEFLSEMNIEYFCAADGRLRDFGSVLYGGDRGDEYNRAYSG